MPSLFLFRLRRKVSPAECYDSRRYSSLESDALNPVCEDREEVVSRAGQ